jgi:DNA-binding NtrC family response regulator
VYSDASRLLGRAIKVIGAAINRAVDGLTMQSLSILIVEDDAVIAMLLAEMLTDMGHWVCGMEATEAGAVKAAENGQPEFMLVDVELKEGSGVAALMAILAKGPMPYVLMSGGTIGIGVWQGPFLRKPFGERDLVRAIEGVMRSHAV